MSTTIEWKVGDPCPNCGRPVAYVPRPPAARVRLAADHNHGTPVPQSFDTAPSDQIDELGDLYRCGPCWSQFRVKGGRALELTQQAAAADAATAAMAAHARAAVDAAIADAKAAHDAATPPAPPAPPATPGE